MSYSSCVEKFADRQDNIPLADPAELFEGLEYKQSGSVFWADLNKDHRMFCSADTVTCTLELIL